MLLLIKTGSGFLPFLQLLGWMLLLLLLVTSLIIVVLHYHRKRKAAGLQTGEQLTHAPAEQVGYTTGDGRYILFDHSPLISKYKLRLSVNEARFSALQHDYSSLTQRYRRLALATHSSLSNQDTMETMNTFLTPEQEQDIARVNARQDEENDQLRKELEQLNRSYRQLEQEHELLQKTLNANAGSDDEKTQLIYRWQEEISHLRSRLGEQEYLQDLLTEKKLQIDFLQQQLEQRIRLQHEADRNRQTLEANVHNEQQELQMARAQIEELQQHVLTSNNELDQSLSRLGEKEEELLQWQQKAGNLQHDNEHLQEELSSSKQQLGELETALSHHRLELQALRHRLLRHQQSLQRLCQDLAGTDEPGQQASPVINLHVAGFETEVERS